MKALWSTLRWHLADEPDGEAEPSLFGSETEESPEKDGKSEFEAGLDGFKLDTQVGRSSSESDEPVPESPPAFEVAGEDTGVSLSAAVPEDGLSISPVPGPGEVSLQRDGVGEELADAPAAHEGGVEAPSQVSEGGLQVGLDLAAPFVEPQGEGLAAAEGSEDLQEGFDWDAPVSKTAAQGDRTDRGEGESGAVPVGADGATVAMPPSPPMATPASGSGPAAFSEDGQAPLATAPRRLDEEVTAAMPSLGPVVAAAPAHLKPEFTPGPSMAGQKADFDLTPSADQGQKKSASASDFGGDFQGFGFGSQPDLPGSSSQPSDVSLNPDLAQIEVRSEGLEGQTDEGESPAEGDNDFLLTFEGDVGPGNEGALDNESPQLSIVPPPPPPMPNGLDLSRLPAPPSDGYVEPPALAQTRGKGAGLAFLRRLASAAAVVVIVFLATFLALPSVFSEDELRMLAVDLNMEPLFVKSGLIKPEVSVRMPEFTALPEAKSDAPVEEPVLVPTENQGYFSQVAEAIREGEALTALALMKQQPQLEFRMRYDLDMASMVAARYALLVSQPKRAHRYLKDRCEKHAQELSAEICIHYVRALVSLGETQKAAAFVNQLRSSRDADVVSEAFAPIDQALAAATNRTPRAMADHLMDYILSPSMNYEWDRQQSLWLLKGIAKLDLSRWRDFSQIVFQLRRSEFERALKSDASVSGKLSSAVGLTRLLEYLAYRYGHTPLDIEHGQRFLQTADHRLGIVVQALVANMSGRAEVQSADLHKVRGKRPFSEVERLIAVNIALQERRLSKVFHLLRSHMDVISGGQFGFEWKLAGAHYAVEANNVQLANKMYQAFEVLASRNESFVNSFDFWYVKAKLESHLGVSPLPSLSRSQEYALAARERGLVEAVRIEWLARNSQLGQTNLSQIVQKYPWHHKLLSSAILAQGHTGGDPRKYIRMQNNVSSARLVEGREKNLLTDFTIRNLILKI